MALIIVETTAEQPLTSEFLLDAHERVMPCLTVRNAIWRYSLLASDRQRMICTFDAPDAESVRESYRQGGVMFSRIWSGTLMKPDGFAPQQNPALLKVMEATYPPLDEDDWRAVNIKTLHCYAESGIEWIQSYISWKGTKVIYELNAPDLESVRQVQAKLGIPWERVWSAAVLKD